MRLEGYTTPEHEEMLAEEFRKVAESFQDAGIEYDLVVKVERAEESPSERRRDDPRRPVREFE